MWICMIGGSGHVGYCLGMQLVEHGHHVINADIIASKDPIEGVIYKQVDILNATSLEKAFAGCDIVIHLASYGMSGSQMLNESRIMEVNVEGTENVIAACLTCNVGGLVYTSSYNVVFGGQEIINGDESLPYWPMHQHVDAYSRSKCMAEKLVLYSNNRKLADDRRFNTCALRFNGIYGPHDKRHLPRAIREMERGMFCVTYGNGHKSLTQYCSGENCAQSLRLAAMDLSKSQPNAAGNAYFIADGPPVDSFEMFRPLCEFLGSPFPRIRLPLLFMYYVAFFLEIIHKIIHKISPKFAPEPLITRAEVYKMGVTHYMKIDRAVKDLGYKPNEPHSMNSTIEYLKTKGYPRISPQSSIIVSLFHVVSQILIRVFVYGLILYVIKKAVY